jgi:hypothetical protein
MSVKWLSKSTFSLHRDQLSVAIDFSVGQMGVQVKWVSDEVSDEVSGDVSDEVSDAVSGEVSDGVSGEMSRATFHRTCGVKAGYQMDDPS